jgi:hypothetical protein
MASTRTTTTPQTSGNQVPIRTPMHDATGNINTAWVRFFQQLGAQGPAGTPGPPGSAGTTGMAGSGGGTVQIAY